ncbi:FliM/FliN family flagellar motor switch protein [Pseudomonas seleniipraecipitans]|uniref:FliM/FliN family flagellar motor switch protein n=1 Tax=Phytopseudomonas seleniipraecipitans TaxID=640205 RepID=A0ABY5JA44_9GAMM|nr:FliM/FliN family flagellar motor switch protein [Pseudomonas seleniipraecipitans]UUD64924.1 FliM/FliN family flagellar motor switch protein [Pseudomonas seleniipraecipitans]
MLGHSKIHHDVQPAQLLRLKPHKLGRHYHRIPNYIRETSSKYPRLISDYFLRNYRINLELQGVDVLEHFKCPAECSYRFSQGKVGFAIERSLLTEALECYYGGTSLPGGEMPPESSSEQRMRERLGGDVVQLLLRALFAGEDVGKLTHHDSTYDEVQWEYQAEFRYLSHITGTQASLFLYLDAQLVDELTRRHSPPPARLNGNPAQHIQQLPVHLNCVLARLRMPLLQVLNLQQGDVLPIRLAERCDIEINQQKLFRGTVFEEDGALFLTSLESVQSP